MERRINHDWHISMHGILLFDKSARLHGKTKKMSKLAHQISKKKKNNTYPQQRIAWQKLVCKPHVSFRFVLVPLPKPTSRVTITVNIRPADTASFSNTHTHCCRCGPSERARVNDRHGKPPGPHGGVGRAPPGPHPFFFSLLRTIYSWWVSLAPLRVWISFRFPGSACRGRRLHRHHPPAAAVVGLGGTHNQGWAQGHSRQLRAELEAPAQRTPVLRPRDACVLAAAPAAAPPTGASEF